MLKLVKYINERGGFAVVPALEQPIITFQSLKRVFEEFLRHEMTISVAINELVHLAFQEKDYATHNFLQWYVQEQIEEEHVARVMNENSSRSARIRAGCIYSIWMRWRTGAMRGRGGGGEALHLYADVGEN